MNGFKVVHTKPAQKNKVLQTQSDNYTCHQWDQASKLVICTAYGEIMICDYDGFVQFYLKDSPLGNKIECIHTFSKGLIVAGDNGYIWAYKIDSEAPYSLFQQKIGLENVSNSYQDSVTSICLSANEDRIFFVNRNN